MRRTLGAFGFFVSLILGVMTFYHSFDHDQQKRHLASIEANYDLTCIFSEELSKTAKARVVNGLKATRRAGHLGLSLGHFVFTRQEEELKSACARNESKISDPNDSRLACQEYPKIKLEFSADEEATGGEKRSLTVESDCSVSTDLSKTDPIWIPWEALSKETPFEGETQYHQPSKILVRLQNISDKWPSRWILERIELNGTSASLSIDAETIRKTANRPLVFEFK